MPKLLDADTTMPLWLFCCHAHPVCPFVHHSAPFCLFVQLLLLCSFSCSSSSMECAWEQMKFTLLALNRAILPFLQPNGREELHCIGHGFVGPSEKKRWGILASWWAPVSMKGEESIVDRLQPLSEISCGEKSGWWVRREQSVSLKHH